MNSICDIFFSQPAKSNQLRFINLFDKNFKHQEDTLHEGYIGTAIHRIKLIPMISSLRKSGIDAYSVPIDYRDSDQISKLKAFDIAETHAKQAQMAVSFDLLPGAKENPLFWTFPIRSIAGEEKVGGMVMIDRIDGHRWTLEELDQYMYDYNNVF